MRLDGMGVAVGELGRRQALVVLDADDDGVVAGVLVEAVAGPVDVGVDDGALGLGASLDLAFDLGVTLLA